jgi:radical SAM superfamily enzyme YgiQ (UPF0313 family)
MHVLRALALCRQVKRSAPACKTVAGGHHATLLAEDFFDPCIDYVICGEGVHPFRSLLRALEKQDLGTQIPGVWARVNGSFVSGGKPLSYELDSLPLPDRSLTASDRDSYFIDWMKPIALVRTTVGCPYRCSFCSLWKVQDGRYHVRDVERVAAEIGSIAEDCVFLVDDEAFVNGKRMWALAQCLKSSGVRKRYFTYCRIDTLLRQPQLMELWAEIGLERLFIGIEAISSTELDLYNKRLSVMQIEDGLRRSAEIGISVFGGFIVNPNYTRQSFKQLVRFIEHNKVDYPSFTILTPLPGTADLDTFDRVTERQPNGRPNWELFDLQHVVTETFLPRGEFDRQYTELFRVFGGVYLPHRPAMPQPGVVGSPVMSRC